jgi:glycosyltransferase involved in cell wall biosynthesis
VHIYTHPLPIEAQSVFGLILEYGNAFFWEVLLSLYIFLRKPFQIIHAANPPDHLFLVALPYKLFNVKFIFDHHDITPENFVAKFGKRGMMLRLLLFMEKLTLKTADLIISTNESYKKIAMQRGGRNDADVVVVRNGPDLSRISVAEPDIRLRTGFTYLVGYVGIIGQQEGIENLLNAIAYIVQEKKRTDIRFIVVGTGTHLKQVMKKATEMGIDRYIWFTGFVPDEKLYTILASVDVCVNPEFSNEFTDKSTMIKIMEYMAFGKPIVQFFTTEGKVSAADAAFYIMENSEVNFAEALLACLDDRGLRETMGRFGRKRIEENLSWQHQKEYLFKAYERVRPLA